MIRSDSSVQSNLQNFFTWDSELDDKLTLDCRSLRHEVPTARAAGRKSFAHSLAWTRFRMRCTTRGFAVQEPLEPHGAGSVLLYFDWRVTQRVAVHRAKLR